MNGMKRYLMTITGSILFITTPFFLSRLLFVNEDTLWIDNLMLDYPLISLIFPFIIGTTIIYLFDKGASVSELSSFLLGDNIE